MDITKEDILKEIRVLEDAIFELKMIDHWSENDRRLYNEWSDKLAILNQRLNSFE